MGRHIDCDSCEQLRAAVRSDGMRRDAVISQDVMMAPCFSCKVDGVVTAPVEIFTSCGRRKIVLVDSVSMWMVAG